MIENVITAAHKAGGKVGLCGQAPSDHPEFAEFLVECGIDFDLRQPRQLRRGQAGGGFGRGGPRPRAEASLTARLRPWRRPCR